MRRKGSFSNYERMFEALLRNRKIPYVAVDEKHRPIIGGGTIKNFDFLVYSRKGSYAIDIKGKNFPQSMGKGRAGLRWQNWVKGDDLQGLKQWHSLMGRFCSPVIIFAYRVLLIQDIFLFHDLFNYEGDSYGLVGVKLENYTAGAQLRSSKWNAYSVKKELFLKIARPLREFIPEINENAPETVTL